MRRSAIWGGEASRAAERTTAIGQAWGNVSEKVALALQALQNQLPVANAVGGAAKMAAQAAADYANEMDKGATETEAAALAAAKLQAAQAQINASSKETVWQINNQVKASEQYTGIVAGEKHTQQEYNQMAAGLTQEKKWQAEEQAKINQLVHDGVAPEQAAAQAAAEHAQHIQEANQAALERLHKVQLELQMAQAVTGQQQQVVQYQQTLNDLLGQGVEKELALAVAQRNTRSRSLRRARLSASRSRRWKIPRE